VDLLPSTDPISVATLTLAGAHVANQLFHHFVLTIKRREDVGEQLVLLRHRPIDGLGNRHRIAGDIDLGVERICSAGWLRQSFKKILFVVVVTFQSTVEQMGLPLYKPRAGKSDSLKVGVLTARWYLDGC